MIRYLKRLTSAAGSALVLFVFLVPLTAQAAAPGTESPGKPRVTPKQAAAWQRANAEGAGITRTARTLERYLVRQPDGTLKLDAPAAVVSQLPEVYVARLTTALGATNAKVARGALQTTEAGAVFDPKTDGLTFQGGWSGYGQDWWHHYYCLSHEDLQFLLSGQFTFASLFGIAVISAMSGAFGLATAAVGGVFGWWMFTADTGNGSCLNAGHWPPPNMWVTGQ